MQFTYRAKQDRRTEASGVIEAVDLPGAVSHLKRMGLYPLEVVPLEAKKGSLRFSALSSAQRSLTRTELALWSRTVGQGLAAGMTLTRALQLLAEQEKGRPLGQVAESLREGVTAGRSLSDAMTQTGRGFPAVAVALARAGEAGGALEEVLQALTEQVEAEQDLVAKVRGALAYPLFVLFAGVGTVAVLMWVVVPKLGALFAETGQPIPLTTRLLIRFGKGFLWSLAAAAAGLPLAAWLLRLRGRRLPLVQWLGAAGGWLPVFRRLTVQAEVARLSSTLGLLLAHGLPLPESLRLAAGTVGRPTLKAQVLRMEREVVEGTAVSAALERAGIREPFLQTLVAMGEAQGDLARAFQQAGIRYHQEVDRTVRVLGTLIEPVMILIVGLVVGGIVISLMLPLFQINFAAG